MSQAQHKRWRAQQALERQLVWLNTQLQSLGAIAHLGPLAQVAALSSLAPALEFVDWLLPECGPTTPQTQSYAKEIARLRDAIRRFGAPKPAAPPPPPAPPPRGLRIVK